MSCKNAAYTLPNHSINKNFNIFSFFNQLFQIISSLHVFWPKIHTNFSHLLNLLHGHSISSYLICSKEIEKNNKLMKSLVMQFSPVSMLPLTYIKIFSATPSSRTSSVNILPLLSSQRPRHCSNGQSLASHYKKRKTVPSHNYPTINYILKYKYWPLYRNKS